MIRKFENYTASEKKFVDLVIVLSNSPNGIQGGKMRSVENILAEKLLKLP